MPRFILAAFVVRSVTAEALRVQVRLMTQGLRSVPPPGTRFVRLRRIILDPRRDLGLPLQRNSGVTNKVALERGAVRGRGSRLSSATPSRDGAMKAADQASR